MLEEIRELYAYNRWANHRVLDAAAKPTTEELCRDLRNSFPSVRDTLAHILGAEWIWLRRWKGSSPAGFPVEWELPNIDALRARWNEVEREQQSFIDGLTPEELPAPLEYRSTKGDAFSNPLWQLLRHVVNHSSYHRGQVVTLLRQLGAAAVSTDLVLFYRENPHIGGERPSPAELHDQSATAVREG